MLPETLIRELHKLNRAGKLRAMQVLVTELAVEEEPILRPGETYELMTPYGNEEAAQVLSDFLGSYKYEA